MSLGRCRLPLVATCTALIAACGGDLTGPVAEGLPCANAVTPPERYAVPHRYADTTVLTIDKPGDPDDGLFLGYIIRSFPDEPQRCLTLSDSLYIHPAQHLSVP